MERKIKILFVSSGNSSDFATAPFIKSQGDSLRSMGVDLDFYTIKGRGIGGYIKNIIPLHEFIKQNNYMLIHAHYALSAWSVILALTGLPVIVSLMGSDVYGDVNSYGKRNLKSYFNIISALLIQPVVKKIIVKSHNLFEYIYLKSKTYIIPNGINLEMIKPYNKSEALEKIGLDHNFKYILFMGNPSNERKNFDLLNKTINHLPSQHIKILNPFPISHKMVPYYLSAADVVILTSYLEGSPNVIKEAMGCNCPIVSTDVGDVRWVFGNTEGCFITSFDQEDVAEKIIMALDFSEKFGRTNGRDRIISLGLSSETVAEKIIEVYKQVIKYAA